jgi:hypothetical protein
MYVSLIYLVFLTVITDESNAGQVSEVAGTVNVLQTLAATEFSESEDEDDDNSLSSSGIEPPDAVPNLDNGVLNVLASHHFRNKNDPHLFSCCWSGAFQANESKAILVDARPGNDIPLANNGFVKAALVELVEPSTLLVISYLVIFLQKNSNQENFKSLLLDIFHPDIIAKITKDDDTCLVKGNWSDWIDKHTFAEVKERFKASSPTGTTGATSSALVQPPAENQVGNLNTTNPDLPFKTMSRNLGQMIRAHRKQVNEPLSVTTPYMTLQLFTTIDNACAAAKKRFGLTLKDRVNIFTGSTEDGVFRHTPLGGKNWMH